MLNLIVCFIRQSYRLNQLYYILLQIMSIQIYVQEKSWNTHIRKYWQLNNTKFHGAEDRYCDGCDNNCDG